MKFQQERKHNMEKALENVIMAQRAEAEEFNKTPGNWMGMLPHPSETEYWNKRVPTGTLKEYERLELLETAYYVTADFVSKGYARSLDFANWSDRALQRHIDNILKNEAA